MYTPILLYKMGYKRINISRTCLRDDTFFNLHVAVASHRLSIMKGRCDMPIYSWESLGTEWMTHIAIVPKLR